MVTAAPTRTGAPPHERGLPTRPTSPDVVAASIATSPRPGALPAGFPAGIPAAIVGVVITPTSIPPRPTSAAASSAGQHGGEDNDGDGEGEGEGASSTLVWTAARREEHPRLAGHVALTLEAPPRRCGCAPCPGSKGASALAPPLRLPRGRPLPTAHAATGAEATAAIAAGPTQQPGLIDRDQPLPCVPASLRQPTQPPRDCVAL